MDAAQTTITTVDAAVGFGLLSFYSSVADAVITAVVSVLVIADVVVATTTVTAVNGLSSFLFSSAAAETMVPAANFFTGAVFAAPSYISNEGFCTKI